LRGVWGRKWERVGEGDGDGRWDLEVGVVVWVEGDTGGVVVAVELIVLLLQII
jgi:hypothetical protein